MSTSKKTCILSGQEIKQEKPERDDFEEEEKLKENYVLYILQISDHVP